MKKLLIIYSSQTGNTKKLAEICYQAALSEVSGLTVLCKEARDVVNEDLSFSDAYVFASPENFGYMSGEMKALFDRTYNSCRDSTAGKTYSLIISCDNDGVGAKKSFNRILCGYGMKDSQLCLIAKSNKSFQSHCKMAKEIGLYMSLALCDGII